MPEHRKEINLKILIFFFFLILCFVFPIGVSCALKSQLWRQRLSSEIKVNDLFLPARCSIVGTLTGVRILYTHFTVFFHSSRETTDPGNIIAEDGNASVCESSPCQRFGDWAMHMTRCHHLAVILQAVF